MKQFIIKLAIVVCSVFALNMVFGFIMKKHISPTLVSGETGGFQNSVIKNDSQIDFLIMGSSRAKHQINPDSLTCLVGKGYNIGINGAGTVYTHLLLQYFLKKGVKIHTVVFETDIENYYNFEDESAQLKDLHNLTYILEKDSLFGQYQKNTPWKHQAKNRIEMYQYNGFFFNTMYNYVRKGSVDISNNGFAPLYTTINTKNITKTFTTPKYFGFSTEKINALAGMQAICKQYNVDLKVVFLPYLNNGYFIKSEAAQLMNKLSFLSKEQLIDLSNIETCNQLNNPEYWKDDRHLNAKGAAVLSQILNSAIKSPTK